MTTILIATVLQIVMQLLQYHIPTYEALEKVGHIEVCKLCLQYNARRVYSRAVKVLTPGSVALAESKHVSGDGTRMRMKCTNLHFASGRHELALATERLEDLSWNSFGLSSGPVEALVLVATLLWPSRSRAVATRSCSSRFPGSRSLRR